MLKNWRSRTTFWSWDVEKLHAICTPLKRQNVKKLTGSEHFLKLASGKLARRCGARHIFKSKGTKHTMLKPLFEIAMSKNCTPLWREPHLQVKMLKNWRSRNTFWSQDVEKLHAAVARSTFSSQNVQNTSKHLRFGTLLGVPMSKRCRTKEIDRLILS